MGVRARMRDLVGGRVGGGTLRVVLAVLVALLAVPVLSVVAALPASAIGNGTFALKPVSTSPTNRAIFTPLLSAGIPEQDAVAVENLTTTTLSLYLYASDGYTDEQGSFALEPNFKPKVKMGKWIHLPVTAVTLPPKSGDVVHFTYNPPANAAPGDYAGGIVAEEEHGPVNKKGHVHVQVLKAVGIAVLGRVNGPLTPNLAVTHVTVTTTSPLVSQFGGPVDATVTYSVSNTGNETVKPAVTVSLSPLIGGAHKVHVQMPKILPGSTVTFRHLFTSVVPFVVLSATVTAKADGVTATGSGKAVVIPWALVAIVVVLIVLFFVIRRRRRRRSEQSGTESGATPPGSTPAGPGESSEAAPPSAVGSGASTGGP